MRRCRSDTRVEELSIPNLWDIGQFTYILTPRQNSDAILDYYTYHLLYLLVWVFDHSSKEFLVSKHWICIMVEWEDDRICIHLFPQDLNRASVLRVRCNAIGFHSIFHKTSSISYWLFVVYNGRYHCIESVLLLLYESYIRMGLNWLLPSTKNVFSEPWHLYPKVQKWHTKFIQLLNLNCSQWCPITIDNIDYKILCSISH